MHKAEDYEHLPIKQVHLEWRAKADDPDFRSGKFLGQEFPLSFDIAVHPNDSERIIVNYPGMGGDIDGYNAKYKKLAQYMQGEGLGAVVRSGMDFITGFAKDTEFRKMVDYSLENAEAISGSKKPEVLMMGFSAGASVIAATAYKYENVARILLMAPSGDMGMKEIIEGLQRFAGEVYIVIGQEDEVVGVEAGQKYFDVTTGASHKELHIIPNCSHQFRGEVNGRIMSQAPIYAFTKGEKPKFPDPQGGIVLY